MVAIILTGATGTVGKAVLQQAIKSPRITRIFALGRTAPAAQHEKLTFIAYTDFAVYPVELLDRLRGAQACIWCIGLSGPVRFDSTADLERVNRDWPLAAARAFAGLSNNFLFCFTSALAIRWTMTWPVTGRVKAEAEKRLAETYNAALFRLGKVLRPEGEGWFGSLGVGLMRTVAPSNIMTAADLADVMLDVAINGPAPGKGGKEEAGVYSVADIQAAISRLHGAALQS